MTEIKLPDEYAARLQRIAQQHGLSIDEAVSKLLDLYDQKPVLLPNTQLADPSRYYFDAVDKLSLGVAIVDMRQDDRPFIFVNPEFGTIVGQPPNNLIGENASIFGRTFTPLEEIEKLSRAMFGGNPTVVTLTNFRGTGQDPYWVEVHATPTFDEHAKLAYIIILMIDVTQYVNFQDKARRSEALYSSSFELLSEAIMLYDGQGKLLTCNTSTERILGRTRQQLMDSNHNNAPYWEPLREDMSPMPREEQPLRLAVMGKPQRNVVLGLRRPEQPDKWVRINSQPICPPGDDKPYGIIVSFTDITSEHNAYQNLRESEERFRNLADYAPVMIWMTTTTAECNYLNQTWYDFTGRTPEQELGFGWVESIHPEDRERTRTIYTDAFAVQAAFRIEYRLIHHDGSYHWIIASGIPRFLPGGAFAGYIGTSADVTDIKNARLALEKSNHELEDRVRLRTEQLHRVYKAALAEQMRINDLKTHFLSVVAHEFRNPLAVMKIAAWFLRSPDDSLPTNQRTEKLDQINNQIERLNRLVADVSTAYKLQSSSFQINLGIVDVAQAVRSVASDVEELSDTASEIHFEIPPHLLVQTDEQLFSHIVTNLLSNALKYSSKGKPITVGLTMREGWLDLTVRDQGIGIPEEDQVKLFELFHRGQNTGTIKGTGLGLAIVKYCVDALAGRIEWESKVNQGTTFTVSIPLDRAPD